MIISDERKRFDILAEAAVTLLVFFEFSSGARWIEFTVNEANIYRISQAHRSDNIKLNSGSNSKFVRKPKVDQEPSTLHLPYYFDTLVI